MSILIKGMEMPIMKDNTAMKMEICKIGGRIEIGIKDGGPHCSEQWHYYEIAEVPEPHGRLIDADKLMAESERYYMPKVDIEEASTVIEAEE